MKKGFTLIELLVVVLIIGILAAIAVPKYQKAVYKSRLTQWATYVSSAHRAMEIWELSNSVSDKNVRFMGNATASEVQGYLDIDLTCKKTEGISCYTDIGRFNLGCNTNNSCWIDFTFTDSTGQADTNKVIWTSRYNNGNYNNKPVLVRTPTDKILRKLVCEWWDSYYGKAQMTDAVLESCQEVGF